MNFTQPPAAPPDAVAQPSRRTDQQEQFDVKTDAYLTWQTSFRNWIAGMRSWCVTMLAEMTQATNDVAQSRQDCSGFAKSAGDSAYAAARAVERAEPAATAAAGAFLQVDKRYLGAKAADPTTDNQGAALQAGAVYYNTATRLVMTWTGNAWVAGISSVSGVSSLNGEVGALKKTTLAQYGIQDFRAGEGLPENVNLASVVTSGIYRYNTAADNPSGVLYSPLLVFRSVDTCAQMLVDYLSGAMFVRSGVINDGVLVDATTRAGPATWRRVAYQNDRAVVTGGVMDLSLGTRFILGVSSMVALSFTNVPAGAVSVVLEINYAAGGFSLPAGSLWANGRVPEIAAGKRHLFFFEKCIAGNTAGWYVSAITGYVA